MSLHSQMMRQRYGLEYSTSLYSQVVFDPIFTPLFAAVFGTAGITIGTTTITFASIASAVAVTALSIGIQMLMAPKPPKAEDGKSPLTQPIPYRIFAVGRVRLAGARMLWEASGSNLYSVNAIAGHRIKSFNRYWYHDDEITLNTGNVVGGMAAVNGLANGRYAKGGSRVATRVGLATETAYAGIVTALGASGVWTNNHRGDGQASTAFLAQNTNAKNQQKTYPYGIPSLSVEIDGAYCWDFRDPAQDPDDQSTWGWTRNCALILAWHLCFNEFGFGLDYHKALLPVIDLWQEEADICDEDVPLNGGGVENRYECNGWDTAENGPKSALNAILSACDGHLVARGDGARILTVGKFRDSRCTTLTDADIIGHQIQYDVLFEDEVNRLVPKFTYPATDYSTTDTDFFEDTDAQLEAGRVLSEEANYQWVHQWRQARRLGKRDWLRLRQKVKGSIDVRLSGLNAIYGRWVRLDTPIRLPRLNGKVMENRRSVLALTKGGFSMDVVQNPDDIDVWTPSTDEGQQPPVPPAADSTGIVTPVINLVQAQANGGSVYIRVIIIDPEDESLTPVVRYRVADIGAGVPGAWIEQTFPDAAAGGGYINLNTNTVPVNQLLEVEAAFIGANGSYSNWTPTEDVVSTADPTPPGVVTSVTKTPGVGQCTFNWTAPNSGNYAGSKIYWNTVNTFGSASYLGPPEYGAPSSADSATRTITAGTRYAWIVSINGSGVEGTPVATGSFVVT
jgi:hypothetical protein